MVRGEREIEGERERERERGRGRERETDIKIDRERATSGKLFIQIKCYNTVRVMSASHKYVTDTVKMVRQVKFFGITIKE